MWIREFDSTFSFKPQVPCLFKLQHLQRVGLGACALGAASGSLAPWLRTATNLRVANLRRNATWRHAEFKLSLKGSNFSTCLLLSDPSHYMIVWLYRFLFDSITVSFFFCVLKQEIPLAQCKLLADAVVESSSLLEFSLAANETTPEMLSRH